MKAVEHHTRTAWVLLYVRRWLTAPLQLPDGSLTVRDHGSPQGSAISPLLANLFMHYAFDAWMARTYPAVTFERYCDDVVVHCRSQAQAEAVRDAISARLAEVGLELHPVKTRIVYCKDANRRGSAEFEEFTFLGYTFRPRLAKTGAGAFFVSFSPAVSRAAVVRIRRTIRSWRIHRRSDLTFPEIVAHINLRVAGLDRLLRAVLQIRPLRGVARDQHHPHAVGPPEIQIDEAQPETCLGRLGSTIDDALGEAFDKAAKLLGLPYPGGPAIEAAARRGDARRFALPRPLLGRPGADFSLSGLKTALRLAAEEVGAASASDVDDSRRPSRPPWSTSSATVRRTRWRCSPPRSRLRTSRIPRRRQLLGDRRRCRRQPGHPHRPCRRRRRATVSAWSRRRHGSAPTTAS